MGGGRADEGDGAGVGIFQDANEIFQSFFGGGGGANIFQMGGDGIFLCSFGFFLVVSFRVPSLMVPVECVVISRLAHSLTRYKCLAFSVCVLGR